MGDILNTHVFLFLLTFSRYRAKFDKPGGVNTAQVYYQNAVHFTNSFFQAEEVNNSDFETQFSATRTYYNTGRTGVENHQQAFQSSANQGNHGQIAHAPPTQGLGRGDQNQNYPSWPAPRGLIGVIPRRELNMRPEEDDADNSPNYRRMAVCQETDGALGQRTKMRVYMKRFWNFRNDVFEQEEVGFRCSIV